VIIQCCCQVLKAREQGQGQGLVVREQGQGLEVLGQGQRQGQELVNWSSRIVMDKDFPGGQENCDYYCGLVPAIRCVIRN